MEKNLMYNEMISSENVTENQPCTSNEGRIENGNDQYLSETGEHPNLEDINNSPKKEKMQYKKKKKKDQIIKDEVEGGEDKTMPTRVMNTQSNSKQDKHKSQNLKKEQNKYQFPNYIPVKKIKHILETQNTVDDKYVKGYLHIHPEFYNYAYVFVPEWHKNLVIKGVINRNRALDGDLVVAHIKSPDHEEESNNYVNKTGTIVCILDKVHPRKFIGVIQKRKSDVIVYPRDKKLPHLKICATDVPKACITNSYSLNGALCMADILTWKKPQFAVGEIIEVMGNAGNISAESRAILLQYNLNTTPFSQDMLEGIPASDYVPTADDLLSREDWREECVFTIDPNTATNLDDAVSCRLLDNGNYKVGVHVADVTHFLKFLSPLDIQVAKRATSVHMTDNVYHMLPPKLRDLCSLIPGQDKLTFSVVWEITPNAIIVSHRIVKTVIRSCCQMSYEQAQMFIHNIKKKWSDDSLSIKGPFTIHEVLEVLSNLYDLSLQLQEKRFAEGALHIHQPKFEIILDKATGLPTSYNFQEFRDSNRLIQEFMLLANVTVANYLYETKPDAALFICNAKPSTARLNNAKSMLEKFGIHLEIDSPRSLQASIKRYEQVFDSDPEEYKKMTEYRMMVINNLCMKALKRATYKCLSTVSKKEDLYHHTLNVPLYTQFTSPLQRYSDCVVHRLLQLSIYDRPLPDGWTKQFCAEIAENCNVKKHSAKLAQESSAMLYFIHLAELKGSITVLAIVSEIRKNTFDVIICETGFTLKINIKDVETVASVQFSTDYSVPTITVSWKKPKVKQMITLFTLVNLRVEGDRKNNKLHGTLLPPQQTQSD